MKKRYIYLSIAVFFFLPLQFAFSQEDLLKTRVAIIPMLNLEKDEQYDHVCSIIDDTVKLNLDLLRRYVVTQTERMDPYMNPEGMRKYAEDNSIDNIVFGKAFLNKEGSLVFQMSVYDRVKEKITITEEEEAQNIFQIFDAANRLVMTIVEEFSGMHIGYGAIRLNNKGEEGVYSVYIDGEKSGDNIDYVEKVLNGLHTVEIRQMRMLGPETIFLDDMWIYERKIEKIEFSIPYLLSKESLEVERLMGIIDELSDEKRERETVSASYTQLLDLFEDVSFCWRLGELRDQYRQMEVEYRLIVNWWKIEDNFFNPKKSTFDELVEINNSADSYHNPLVIQRKVSENADFLYNVYGINAAYNFSQGEMEEGYNSYKKMYQMVELIPPENYYLFDEEKTLVDETVGGYLGKRHLLKRIAVISTKKRVDGYFGNKLRSSAKLYKKETKTAESELIVISNPSGMKVYANDKYSGRSPVRIKFKQNERVNIFVKDPWFSQESAQIDLREERNFVFLRSNLIREIETQSVEILGQKSFRLLWDIMPGAESYIVEIDALDGDFKEAFFVRDNIVKNSFHYKKRLDEEYSYKYRVRAVNENRLKSIWSSSGTFEDRIEKSFSTGGKIVDAVTVSREGMIYVGSDDRCLYALQPDADPQWLFVTGGKVRSSPGIGKDGCILCGSDDGYLYSLSPDGNVQWVFGTGGSIRTSPIVGSEDGMIYIGSEDGNLYALSPEGAESWHFISGGQIHSTPALGSDGTIYFGSDDGVIYALYPNGEMKWEFPTGGSILSSPSIDQKGTIYVGSSDHSFYALNPDGSLKWIFQTGAPIISSPVIDSEGKIYFGSDDFCLYALNKKGELEWIFSTDDCVRTTPSVRTDGTIIFSNRKNNIYALNPDGSLLWRYRLEDEVSTSPVVGKSERILIGSDDRRLYLLKPDM